ncbi:hypothetical protein PRIC1_013799 [Phytophthora ramorum]
MVRPLNKEWELFGHRYRVAGAKVDRVDCKACQKQVSAAVNRLQSHLRVCPARSSLGEAQQPSTDVGHSSLSDAIPTPSELADHAIEADSLCTETATTTGANSAESNAPPAKKQRQSPARTRDRPRWSTTATSAAAALNEDDLWLNSIVEGPATTAQAATTSAFNKRRLEIEEKRLQLEIKRDQREQRRERLNLEILEAQARKEKLLAEKHEYEAKVVLALSRNQLRDQGISDEEIDRILPVSSPGSVRGSNSHDQQQ